MKASSTPLGIGLLLPLLFLCHGCTGLEERIGHATVWENDAAARQLILEELVVEVPTLSPSANRQIRDLLFALAAEHGFSLTENADAEGLRAMVEITVTEQRIMRGLRPGYSSAVSALLRTPSGKRGALFYRSADTEHGFSSQAFLYRQLDSLFRAMERHCPRDRRGVRQRSDREKSSGRKK